MTVEKGFEMGEKAVKVLWGLLFAAFALGGWVTLLQYQVSDNASRLKTVEDKQQTMERTVIEMASDIKWMRREMEQGK